MKILAALRGTADELKSIKTAQAANPELADLTFGNLLRLALARLLKIELPMLKHGGERKKSLAPTGDKTDESID